MASVEILTTSLTSLKISDPIRDATPLEVSPKSIGSIGDSISFPVDYSSMTVKDLKSLCKILNIKGYSSKKKEALISMLSNNCSPDPLVPTDEFDRMSISSITNTSVPIMSNDMYNLIILEIISVAKSIGVKKSECDGRIDSAMKETPFLNEMKTILNEKHPEWDIVIPPIRASCDIMVNSIRINLKLTDCKSSDNSVNKPSIYYSITGLATYPYSSNWNDFLNKLIESKAKNQIKKERYRPTEYHYLVKNKLTGDVLLKPIFDIYNYVSNASNDLQINWKNEFAHSEYRTEEAEYLKKVGELLLCIQKSVKEMIERTKKFAEADVEALLT
jgi:hypothetical protein